MSRLESCELTNMVMVEDGQGRLLMQERNDPGWPGLVLPGGHVEPGESFVRAAVREVFEETGLTVSGLTLCGVKQFPCRGGRYIVLLYRAASFSGELRGSAEGGALWVPRAELGQHRLASGLAAMLKVFDAQELSELYYSGESGAMREEWL